MPVTPVGRSAPMYVEHTRGVVFKVSELNLEPFPTPVNLALVRGLHQGKRGPW